MQTKTNEQRKSTNKPIQYVKVEKTYWIKFVSGSYYLSSILLILKNCTRSTTHKSCGIKTSLSCMASHLTVKVRDTVFIYLKVASEWNR